MGSLLLYANGNDALICHLPRRLSLWEPFSDCRSKIPVVHHFAAVASCQSLENSRINLDLDTTNRAVGEKELPGARMRREEVIRIGGSVIERMRAGLRQRLAGGVSY